MMKKKKIFIFVIILSLIVLLGIYYSFIMGHHNFYGRICGSGINGIKQLVIYLPLLLVIVLIILMYNYKQSRKKCKYCGSNIDEEFKVCPYCGNFI